MQLHWDFELLITILFCLFFRKACISFNILLLISQCAIFISIHSCGIESKAFWNQHKMLSILQPFSSILFSLPSTVSNCIMYYILVIKLKYFLWTLTLHQSMHLKSHWYTRCYQADEYYRSSHTTKPTLYWRLMAVCQNWAYQSIPYIMFTLVHTPKTW